MFGVIPEVPQTILIFSILFIFYFFFSSNGCFSLSCLPNHWFKPLLCLIWCWFHLIYPSFQLLYSVFLTGSFFMIFISLLCCLPHCWSSHWVHLCMFLLSSLSILTTSALNSLSGRLLISVSCSSFLEFCPGLFWGYISLSFMWDISLCVCFLRVRQNSNLSWSWRSDFV